MVLAALLTAATGCTDDSADAAPAVGLEEVRAAPTRTQQGTAAVRIDQRVEPAGQGSGAVEGRWDFDRRQGTFTATAGTTIVIAHGAVFTELSAEELAEQAGDAPEYRHQWSPRRVPTTDDYDEDDYFGLSTESLATFADAFAVLLRATSVEDLGPGEVGGTPARHVRVPVDTRTEGALPTEVWLDGEGRVRRIRLAAENGPLRLTLEVELSNFGTSVAVEVPPIDALNPSGEIVPVEPWGVLASGQQGGRRWRVRAAADSRLTEDPPAQGRCLALEQDPFPPEQVPPVWFECHGPRPVNVYRRVPPDLRDSVLLGSAGPPLSAVPVTFADGATMAAEVDDGVFLLFTEGRKVAAVNGEPLE